MKGMDLFKLELLKMKRSRMIALLSAAPILVVVSGVVNLSQYLTPEYTQAWPAMFIQSALLYAYYLLPFSMIVVCVMIAGRETQNNGMLKMLALPVSRFRLSLAKFGVLVFCLLLEMVVFLLIFVLAGWIAVQTAGVKETLPLGYLLQACGEIFVTMLPCTAVMWMVTVVFEKPLITVGLNLMLVIPGLLAGATPLWFLYPYCYSGYLVSCSLHEFTVGGLKSAFPLFPFLPCALAYFLSALGMAAVRFGKKEMR
ncbi:ABC transporter permease [Holdemania filiformis]|uniref:ABC transporter permease n=1 Tax=Holdemania filiformis TaxID=61171 RepID=UPI002670BF04|nr:ABC transporter permease [Holdemania filiformis]